MGPEQISNLTIKYVPGTGVSVYQTCLSRLLSETGIIGTSLFYIFIWQSIKYTDKISSFYKGIENDFCIGVRQSQWLILIFSVYFTVFQNPYMFFVLGLTSALCLDFTFKNCRLTKYRKSKNDK